MKGLRDAAKDTGTHRAYDKTYKSGLKTGFDISGLIAVRLATWLSFMIPLGRSGLIWVDPTKKSIEVVAVWKSV